MPLNVKIMHIIDSFPVAKLYRNVHHTSFVNINDKRNVYQLIMLFTMNCIYHEAIFRLLKFQATRIIQRKGRFYQRYFFLYLQHI